MPLDNAKYDISYTNNNNNNEQTKARLALIVSNFQYILYYY